MSIASSIYSAPPGARVRKPFIIECRKKVRRELPLATSILESAGKVVRSAATRYRQNAAVSSHTDRWLSIVRRSTSPGRESSESSDDRSRWLYPTLGTEIGLRPVLSAGSGAMRKRVPPAALPSKQFACSANSDAVGGSGRARAAGIDRLRRSGSMARVQYRRHPASVTHSSPAARASSKLVSDGLEWPILPDDAASTQSVGLRGERSSRHPFRISVRSPATPTAGEETGNDVSRSTPGSAVNGKSGYARNPQAP